MEYLDPNIENTNSITINQISSNFHSILPDFERFYVLHHANPDVDEYTNTFNEKRSQLYSQSKQLHDLSINIENDILLLDKEINKDTVSLHKIKKKNIHLSKQIKSLQNTKRGSQQLTKDYISEYNNQRFHNLEVFVGIVAIFGTLYYQTKR